MEAQAPNELPVGTKLGHYILEGKIAEGGMGTVYKALEPALERHVAVKILHQTFAADPTHQAQFIEEAKAVAALRHNNIVPLHFVGQEGSISYFAMAYIEGMTLDEYQAQHGNLDPDWARWFMSQAIAALDYASRSNIIHLDIKPSNFMVDNDNTILLTDFGLARRGQAQDHGELMGTPFYASPEHIMQKTPDLRTDIYSLGATLFHLMTGKPVFEADSLEEICRAQVHDPFPMPKATNLGVPFGWACLMSRMMEKNPGMRFQTYAELKETLRDVDNYRYGANVISLPPVKRQRGLPRYSLPPETLFGILPDDWGDEEIPKPTKMNPDDIVQMLNDRQKTLNANALLEDLVDLCHPGEDSVEVLVQAINESPSFAATVGELTGFMSGIANTSVDDNTAKIEMLGTARARNLALTCLMLEKRWHAVRPLDWRGTWQHMVSTGILCEMISDMLGLEDGGFSYVVGLLHDVGKIILGELLPNEYPAIILASLENDTPLIDVEREYLGIDHAQIGAMWMHKHRVPNLVCEVVDFHHEPEELNVAPDQAKKTGFLDTAVGMFHGPKVNKMLLACAVHSANHLTKQLGLGFSGNTYLDQAKWEELETTLFLWDSRQIEINFDDFVQFFTWDAHKLPDVSVAGFGIPNEIPD